MSGSGAVSLQGRNRPRHFHRLGRNAHRQLQVHSFPLVEFKHDSAVNDFAETNGRNRNLVWPRNDEVGNGVVAILIGLGGHLHVRGGVCNHDIRAGNGRAGRVGDNPQDGAGRACLPDLWQ